MNIAKAKEQIKNTVKAYLTKDEFGGYKIPVHRQRPIFLMGAPGIGKTAIMEQIAGELKIGLVSYSMTHHTRQSALGLPFIVEKSYGGVKHSVSEYTMSEIIASVYDMMEETGVKEGILFLDEINCVSETLAPAMLQFLQYKVFGRNRVPEGWTVVTAGNPPEYNKSVREFDVVTWDRLKRIDVEPDYEAWHAYAQEGAAHPSVLSYLAVKKEDFYRVETTVSGKSFVTARGWDDLSQMIFLYEENGIKVDEDLVCQYLQNARIAKDFAIYYDLFNKYRADYKVEAILAGKVEESILKRARAARFDERLSLMTILIDAVMREVKGVLIKKSAANKLADAAVELRLELTRPDALPIEAFARQQEKLADEIRRRSLAQTINDDEKGVLKEVCAALAGVYAKLNTHSTAEEVFNAVAACGKEQAKELRKLTNTAKTHMDNAFKFTYEAFSEGQEMLVLLAELTANRFTLEFINTFGCDEYFMYNEKLQFFTRGKNIISQMDKIDFDEL